MLKIKTGRYAEISNDISYDRYLVIKDKLIEAINKEEDMEEIKFLIYRYEYSRKTLDEILEFRKEKEQ